jgi:hypothetical protein
MFTQLASWDNLLLAYRQASKGKRGQPNVAAFERKLEDNLLWLQAGLRDGTYRPGRYYSFFIHEPKRRLISAAPFRDRVVHHALCNLIEPIFERSFIPDSYANRLGKGTHRALDRCQQFARRYPYVLQGDVRQFFPSIDHAILRDLLARRVDDPEVLWLIDQILASGAGVLSEAYDMAWFPGDDLLAAARPVSEGIPFLGFVVYPERRRLKRRKAVHFARRFRQRLRAYQAGEIALEDLRVRVNGWINHVRFGNTVGLRKAILTGRRVFPPRR